MRKPFTDREEAGEQYRPKTFVEMIAPAAIRFLSDHYICGSTFRSVWAVVDYPPSTEEQALLRHLGEKDNVTLHVYTRLVSFAEERQLYKAATNQVKLRRANAGDIQEAVTAETSLENMGDMARQQMLSREPFLHTAVYIELAAATREQLLSLQAEVEAELSRAKLTVDKLYLCQQEGFLSVQPAGRNRFHQQLERVLPASSVANLYPFVYSGKTDANGFYLGRDKYGSNIIVDFDQRDEDKTNGNILILGNSGQGKSYLMKLILCNFLEAGKSVICLDPDGEYRDLTLALGGSYLDLLDGAYRINVLEPRLWQATEGEEGEGQAGLSHYISFLRDFFHSYKAFSDSQLDVLEIMLERLYSQWQINDATDFSRLQATDYPILSDLYNLIEGEYQGFGQDKHPLYTKQMLQEILLGLNSLCRGAESKFFNGYSNIADNRFLTFGLPALENVSENVRNAMLMQILSFMSHALLNQGRSVAVIDELHYFLANPIAPPYIRGFMKRVRKKESNVVLASQNLEDFALPEIRELTKPLFSIPSHAFLFNAGNIDARLYMDTLQLELSEYELIKYPEQGACLYKCGAERYNLKVIAPEYKARLFGKAGGR